MRIRSSSRTRKKEVRPGITLTTGPAPQLVVDPAAFVPFRGENKKTACLPDTFSFRPHVRPRSRRASLRDPPRDQYQCFEHFHLDVPAQLNVGARGRPCWSRWSQRPTCPHRRQSGFLLVLAGVQHIVLNASPVSISLSISDFSIDVVPTRTGWPLAWHSLTLSIIASYFSSAVR